MGGLTSYLPHTIHLDEKLGLDAPDAVGLPLGALPAQRVHFVDEDDGL